MNEGGFHINSKREELGRDFLQQTPSYSCDLVYGGYLASDNFHHQAPKKVLIGQFCKWFHSKNCLWLCKDARLPHFEAIKTGI